MDWSKFAWLNRGSQRKNILLILKNSSRPLTVKEIKIDAKIAISQASITVSELYKQGFVSCKNPNDNIGRLYEINELGREMLHALEQTNNDK